MTVVRINLKKQVSYAGVVHPSLYIVAGVDFSRVRFLNGALTGVTARGTKVVGRGAPMIVNRAAPRAGPVFAAHTGRMGTPVCFTRRRRLLRSSDVGRGNGQVCRAASCLGLRNRLRKLYRLGGAGALLSTVHLLGRTNCRLARDGVHGKFSRMYRLANLVKE